MTEQALISLTGFSIHRGGRALVSGLEWQLMPGQVWSVIGLNGAGKSTLLRALAGLPLSDSFKLNGQLQWSGRPPGSWKRKERAEFLSWMPQSDETSFDCAVRERLLAGLYSQGHALGWDTRADLDRVSKVLVDFDLTGFEDRRLHTLSGGERRRISLAAAQLQGSKVVLLDEPLSQLDWAHQVQIGQTLRQWPDLANRVIVWVTHEPNMALRYSTHLLAISPNGQVLKGSICEMARAEVFESVYGCQIEGSADPFLFFPVTR